MFALMESFISKVDLNFAGYFDIFRSDVKIQKMHFYLVPNQFLSLIFMQILLTKKGFSLSGSEWASILGSPSRLLLDELHL